MIRQILLLKKTENDYSRLHQKTRLICNPGSVELQGWTWILKLCWRLLLNHVRVDCDCLVRLLCALVLSTSDVQRQWDHQLHRFWRRRLHTEHSKQHCGNDGRRPGVTVTIALRHRGLRANQILAGHQLHYWYKLDTYQCSVLSWLLCRADCGWVRAGRKIRRREHWDVVHRYFWQRWLALDLPKHHWNQSQRWEHFPDVKCTSMWAGCTFRYSGRNLALHWHRVQDEHRGLWCCKRFRRLNDVYLIKLQSIHLLRDRGHWAKHKIRWKVYNWCTRQLHVLVQTPEKLDQLDKLLCEPRQSVVLRWLLSWPGSNDFRYLRLCNISRKYIHSSWYNYVVLWLPFSGTEADGNGLSTHAFHYVPWKLRSFDSDSLLGPKLLHESIPRLESRCPSSERALQTKWWKFWRPRDW